MAANEMRIQKLLREESDTRPLGIRVKYMCLSLACGHHKSMNGELLETEQVKKPMPYQMYQQTVDALLCKFLLTILKIHQPLPS